MDISKTIRADILLGWALIFLVVKCKQHILIMSIFLSKITSYLYNICSIGVFNTVEHSHTECLSQNNYSISCPSFTVWFESIFSLSILFPSPFYPFYSFFSPVQAMSLSPQSPFSTITHGRISCCLWIGYKLAIEGLNAVWKAVNL